ncbi:DUF397 domain-containing protein [Amycolatopsis nigrescens]|uniref:DUF397 domain-containing protein n=1 Tax=Amycolatopsis nigrescens TaxID=381445 RepID=UPI000362C423|nr:DUF397 domain-containing protein [Amycolatopsis nigrescens]
MNPPAPWRKSSHSSKEVECVEVALDKDCVRVRDSKNPGIGTLNLPHNTWSAFLSQVSGRE